MCSDVFIGSQSNGISKAEKRANTSPVLPEIYKRQLQRVLHKQSKDIIKQFLDLSFRTLSLLETEGTSAEQLKKHILLTSALRGKSSPALRGVIEPAKSVHDVIICLAEQHFITFYKFTILESIIEKLCIDRNGQLKAELVQYKEHFKVYIKGRVCESSLYCSGKFDPEDACTPKDGCNLILITDENWNGNARMESVLDLECEVADIFDIKNFLFRLQAIEENCLRLYYNIPADVVLVILSIKLEQVLKLMRCGIAELHCGGASQLPALECHPDLIESLQYPQLIWLIRWCVNEDQNNLPTAAQVIDYLHTLQ